MAAARRVPVSRALTGYFHDMTIHIGSGPGKEHKWDKWSLAVLAQDAEAHIGEALDDAASLCDEMVVMDTGSSDGTRTVAAQHGARIVEFEWVDDYATARNALFDACTGTWILWLDPTDRIPSEARTAFLDLKKYLLLHPEVDAVRIPYRCEFSVSDPTVCTRSVEREHVVRRSGARWVGAAYEFIQSAGAPLSWPEAWIEKRGDPLAGIRVIDRKLRILEKAYSNGDRSSRTLFYFAGELRDHERWDEALTVYREYLSNPETDAWERYSALLSMAACAQKMRLDDYRLNYLHEALMLDSTRAEAFVDIGLFHYQRKAWDRAIPFFAAATALRRPAEGFVDQEAYAHAWDYLAVCHSELGRYDEAFEDTVKALRASDDRQRLYANMDFYLQQMRAGRGPKPNS
jgi:glycosyltransferase involved in cell wall biosynthesis